MKKQRAIAISGGLAGAVTGLFGAGGGMVLVPLLTALTDMDSGQVFPCSVSIILPVCLVSLAFRFPGKGLPISDALPYMLGSVVGGLLAGKYGGKIPSRWLHRGLGILILWGGIRYLW